MDKSRALEMERLYTEQIFLLYLLEELKIPIGALVWQRSILLYDIFAKVILRSRLVLWIASARKNNTVDRFMG